MAKINIRTGEAVNGGLALGIMTAAGNPWTVGDELGQELVNRGKATYVTAPSNPSGTLSAVAEVSSGAYKLDLGAGDMNANVVTLRFTASGADDLMIQLLTEP